MTQENIGPWYWRHVASNLLVGPFDSKETAKSAAIVEKADVRDWLVEILVIRTEDSQLLMGWVDNECV